VDRPTALATAAGWEVVATQTIQGRAARTYPIAPLNLGDPAAAYLGQKFDGQVFRHQLEALEAHGRGERLPRRVDVERQKRRVLFRCTRYSGQRSGCQGSREPKLTAPTR
jgi:hypothetical protein